MVRVQTVTDLNHPALAPYRTLRQQSKHFEQKIFVAEGEKVVRRLLESHLRVISLLLPERWWQALETLARDRAEDIDVFLAPKAQLEAMTGFSMYQGVLAAGEIPSPLDINGLLRRAKDPAALVAIDGISSAENVGGIVRNCAAFGVDGIIVSGSSANPFLRRAVRSSMGTIFRLPVAVVPDLPAALRHLRDRGLSRLAADPHAETGITTCDFLAPCCLLLGSEGYGLSPEVRAEADHAIAIPMAPGVDSLNVMNASSVFLYEIWRQRKGG